MRALSGRQKKETHRKLPRAIFAFGNVHTKRPSGKNGWILGRFIPASSPFHNKDLEVKWSKHKKGERKESPKANKTATTLSILVAGKMRVDFLDQSRKVIYLKKEGDFVFFGPGIAHSWEALESSVAATIRWPSLPGDQV